MLIRATENIALALEAEYCAVLLSDPPDADTLRSVAIYSEQSRSGNLDSLEVSVAPASALLSQLARSDAQVITNLSTATNPLAEELRRQGCRSALMIPLRGKDQTVGLLAVGFTQAQRAIGGIERNLAQVFGTQVATAIINRRLYVAEQQRAAELELLQRISQQLTAELSLDETLAAILDSESSSTTPAAASCARPPAAAWRPTQPLSRTA
jgi:GAF domain-containing protein